MIHAKEKKAKVLLRAPQRLLAAARYDYVFSFFPLVILTFFFPPCFFFVCNATCYMSNGCQKGFAVVLSDGQCWLDR